MTDVQLTIIIAAVPPTLVAIGALISSLRNTNKLTEIHTLTNSNLTKVTGHLSLALQKIESMEETIKQMGIDKLVAQHAAEKTQEVMVVNPPTEPVPTTIK